MEVGGVRMGKERRGRRGNPPGQTVGGQANLLFISKTQKVGKLGNLVRSKKNKPVDSSLGFLPALPKPWNQRF